MIKYLLSILFLALPLSAMAESPALVYSTSNLAVQLLDKPCTSEKVKPFIEADKLSNWKAAAVVYMNQPLKACWVEIPKDMTPEPMFGIVDETGDGGLMPKSLFEVDTGKVVPQGTGV